MSDLSDLKPLADFDESVTVHCTTCLADSRLEGREFFYYRTALPFVEPWGHDCSAAASARRVREASL